MKRALSGDTKGRRAELRAEILLRLKGYRILARRFKSGQGEIDLIAKRGSVIAFVEVKFRASADAAIESVSKRQRRRILNAAGAFIAHRPKYAAITSRFDIIVVTKALLPRHLLNAWPASEQNTW
ncbi:MAG: YraN family protein [Alphaproteobacteria bacterium]